MTRTSKPTGRKVSWPRKRCVFQSASAAAPLLPVGSGPKWRMRFGRLLIMLLCKRQSYVARMRTFPYYGGCANPSSDQNQRCSTDNDSLRVRVNRAIRGCIHVLSLPEAIQSLTTIRTTRRSDSTILTMDTSPDPKPTEKTDTPLREIEYE